jgi:hypothetical protein
MYMWEADIRNPFDVRTAFAARAAMTTAATVMVMMTSTRAAANTSSQRLLSGAVLPRDAEGLDCLLISEYSLLCAFIDVNFICLALGDKDCRSNGACCPGCRLLGDVNVSTASIIL